MSLRFLWVLKKECHFQKFGKCVSSGLASSRHWSRIKEQVYWGNTRGNEKEEAGLGEEGHRAAAEREAKPVPGPGRTGPTTSWLSQRVSCYQGPSKQPE